MADRGPAETAHEETGSWYHALICLAAAALAAVALFAPNALPERFKTEHWAADWRTALLSDRLTAPHPNIVIVSITAASLQQFRYYLPIHRGHLADLVDAADKAGASTIGLDFYFTRATEDEADARLVRVLGAAKDKVVLGVYESDQSEQSLKYQFDLIERTGVRAGYIDLVPDSDSVVRYRARPGTGVRHQHSFSSALVAHSSASDLVEPARIAWLLPPSKKERAFLRIESQQLLALPPEKRTALLGGRIVLVGGELFTLDRHLTPLSVSTDESMFGVEIHAHMAAELKDGNRSYAELTLLQTRLLVGGLALLGVVLGARFRRRKWDYLDWRVASFFVIGIDVILFKFFHVALPFTLAAVAWIAGVSAGTQLRSAAAWWRSSWRA